MKPITGSEPASDMRSPSVRSKLLSMILIREVLISHPKIFNYPSPALFTTSAAAQKPIDLAFTVAIKQYICLSITRNIVSVVPQVFDLATEIFCHVIFHLRTLLKVILG
jgi:brefeldin A-inhibited guanine nucleotide-exchange protein